MFCGFIELRGACGENNDADNGNEEEFRIYFARIVKYFHWKVIICKNKDVRLRGGGEATVNLYYKPVYT